MKQPALVYLHDSEGVRQAACTLLCSRGYRATAASDPQQAIDTLKESESDFILLSQLAAGLQKTLAWVSDILTVDETVRVLVAQPDSLSATRSPCVRSAPVSNHADDSAIVGQSSVIRSLRKLLVNIAASHASVLITGETGTGKELVASEIHRRSPRGAKRFVAINCAAIPDTLLESELFGVERGAYTGAHSTRDGKLHSANGGTLFLDELGELTPAAQAKLLRAIETRRVERLGGCDAKQLDVRVIAASNQNLLEMVAEGRFRRDLYFRLAVCQVQVPPLRDRVEDIPILAEHLLEALRRSDSPRPAGLAVETIALLEGHAWPGNVRELRNLLEAVMVEKRDGIIQRSDLPVWFIDQTVGAKITGGRQQLVAALEKTGWNKAAAARDLNCSRMTLYRRISKHEITGGASANRTVQKITGGAKPKPSGSASSALPVGAVQDA